MKTLTAKETAFAQKSDWAFKLSAGLVVRVQEFGQLIGYVDEAARDAGIEKHKAAGLTPEIVEWKE